MHRQAISKMASSRLGSIEGRPVSLLLQAAREQNEVDVLVDQPQQVIFGYVLF